MKQCSRCDKIKPCSEFYVRPRRNGALTSRCKACLIFLQQGRASCTHCGNPTTGRGKTGKCVVCSRKPPGSYENKQGYVKLTGRYDHPNADKQGGILEHRFVMTQILGRPLLEHEEVHHKNGVRNDNRPVNLELWSTSQPKGQRVEDKVEWAREILALYRPQEDK